MLENYLLKGLVIGVVFGVPAGVVGILSIQRVLTQGAFAGFLTGIGSSAADIFYACVGCFAYLSSLLGYFAETSEHYLHGWLSDGGCHWSPHNQEKGESFLRQCGREQ